MGSKKKVQFKPKPFTWVSAPLCDCMLNAWFRGPSDTDPTMAKVLFSDDGPTRLVPMRSLQPAKWNLLEGRSSG